MHFIEPFFGWRNEYVASEDPNSPFFERDYSEFEFTDQIYNYLIHPQWDNMGSSTLFIKILFVDYEDSYAIIELMGEWNDAIENDIMTFKREVIEVLMEVGISSFILIAENVLNFHYSDDSYYEEWLDELEDGWVALVNVHAHVSSEFKRIQLDSYLAMGGELNDLDWRTYNPSQFFNKVNELVNHRFLPL